MLKLKLQCFSHLMQRTDLFDSCWERLKVGGEGDNKGSYGWTATSAWWIWIWVNSRSWWCTGRPDLLHSMGSQSQTGLSNWTELNWELPYLTAIARKWTCKSFCHVRLFVAPWTIAHKAPLFMGFSRQEYWIRLPFPSPRYLPDPGIESCSPALQADSLLARHFSNIYREKWCIKKYQSLQKFLLCSWMNSICLDHSYSRIVILFTFMMQNSVKSKSRKMMN